MKWSDILLLALEHYKPKTLTLTFISKYCAPDCIIMGQDSAFMSTLINYLFRKLNIKIKTVAPYNHQSLQAEHSIKSLSRILTTSDRTRADVA